MSTSRAWFEKDFYSVLGVPETASTEEIKRAYKKIATKHHPDRNPGDKAAEEKMKDASEAYAVLSDEKRRQEYDQLRRMSRAGYAGGGPGAGWQTNIRFEDLPFDLDDLFGGVFGGAARAPRRGNDVESRVRISFEDAMNGVTLPVRVGGESFKVKIPPGIADGARIRARGRGERAARGGESGDLYVRVEVEPHKLFGRNGADLTVTVPISFSEAALGSTIDVPTLDKPVKVKVPAGTPSGKTFRVKGRGVPKAKGGAGDLLVTVQVLVPSKLSKHERELIEKLAETDGAAARERERELRR